MIAALTGFMASGKTTFGRAAAEHLGCRFIDLDELITERYGTIKEIFESHGEDFFRKMESRCLMDALSLDGNIVLALGGGTVLNQKNCELLQKKADTIIWLDTSFEIILSELKNADRPLVNGRSLDQIKDLYEKRKPLYRQIADTVVSIDSFDYSIAVNDLSDAIAGFLKN